jgi:DNA polymerase-1
MTDSRPRLFLIDGSAYIFRAYFALPPLNHSTGLPTHAIYGFTNLLLKFLKQYRPEYVAVVLDAGRETFRNQMFAAYKGNRREPPADLIPQFPYFRRVLEGLQIALLELAGYEADDVIASVCHTIAGHGCDLVVVSSDKDFMQLVTDGIRLLDGAKDRWIGAAEVNGKFGVEPAKVIEVMGLMGDASMAKNCAVCSSSWNSPTWPSCWRMAGFNSIFLRFFHAR